MGALFLLPGCDYKKSLKKPGTLLIYYGYPSAINEGGDPVGDFSKYDYVILGAGLEEETHDDYDETKIILSNAALKETLVFGYIDLGVTTLNHSMAEIKTRIQGWIDIGATGIFFDNCGTDFGNTRSRQNDAFESAHTKGLPVMANSWDPDDLFGSGDPTELTSSDFYLWESFQIKEGAFETEANWQAKQEKLSAYQKSIRFRILAVTTASTYNETQFHYAWYSALLYEIEAVGWGEFNFSANPNPTAPWRNRPGEDLGSSWKSSVSEQGTLFSRKSSNGRVEVDTDSHSSGFIPAP